MLLQHKHRRPGFPSIQLSKPKSLAPSPSDPPPPPKTQSETLPSIPKPEPTSLRPLSLCAVRSGSSNKPPACVEPLKGPSLGLRGALKPMREGLRGVQGSSFKGDFLGSFEVRNVLFKAHPAIGPCLTRSGLGGFKLLRGPEMQEVCAGSVTHRQPAAGMRQHCSGLDLRVSELISG